MSDKIPDGYELLSGRTRANAITALATAAERGLDVQSVLTVRDGFLIPLGDSVLPAEAIVEEVHLPVEKDSHDTIDAFAAEYGVSYDGIEAANVDKPTKAEKVAHITKVLDAQAAENDANLAATGELQSSAENEGE